MNLDDSIADDHWAILAAMVERDGQTAVEVLERHLTLYQEHLKKMQAVYPHYFQSKA